MRDLMWATVLRPFRRYRRWYIHSYGFNSYGFDGSYSVRRAPKPIKPEDFFPKETRHRRIGDG